MTLEDFKSDFDWQHAFYEAFHGADGPSYDAPPGERGPIENVVRVIHSIAGENDEAAWLAVVEWSGEQGAFAVMEAGCDYTGWDCQASGAIDYYPSLEVALSSLTPEQARRLGLPHDADTPAE
jgi:hypothetical protein